LTARLSRLHLLLLRVFSVLVGAAALTCGTRAIGEQLSRFKEPPHRASHPAFDAALARVLERVPEGARLLHLSAEPEYWYSRLWQRALYPRNEVIVVEPPLSAEVVRTLRDRYGVRFAISAGNPPSDPGFLWAVDLGPLPLGSAHNLLGELAP
jgi:hypothetical protein